MDENDMIKSFQIESSSYDNHENKRSLNYSLAIPSFHESLELLLAETKAKRENLAFRSRFDFFVGCVLLFLMIVPCSIIAPLTLSLPAKDTFIKSSWRFQGCTVLAIPTTIFIQLSGMADLRKDFSWRIAFTQFYLSFFMFIWVAGFIVGCSLTVTSHADIMYCSSGVYIFVFTMLTCNAVHRLEILGYVMYFIGVCFMLSDPYASKVGMEGQSFLGDLIAFLGAGGCAMYVYLAKRSGLELHPYVTCTYMFVFLCIHQFMIFPFFSDSQNFFSFDVEYGAFGWLTDDYSMFLVLGINAPITGILGNIGFYTSFLYFPIQIVAGAMLLEPFFAQLAGILLGQDKMPGISTLFGLILISIGFIIAGFGAKYKEDKVKIRNLKIKENSHILDYSDCDNF